MSLERLEEHRRIWSAKPLLAEVYRVWFDALLATLRDGRILEVGAGPGFFATYARNRFGNQWLATDIIETPWNDIVADGARLPFGGETMGAVVALDFVHHLASPAPFFSEAARVLRPGGHIAVVEPWVTLLSYPIYHFVHQEKCTLGIDPWKPFGDSPPAGPKEPFDGEAAVPWRLVQDTTSAAWEKLGFRAPKVKILNAFAYLLSLGFREASLLPRRLAPYLLRLDERARALAPYLGLRALIVWEKV